AEASVTGGELMIGYEFSSRWSVNGEVEYVFNRNITDNYALPFTPSTVVTTDVKYSGNGRKRGLISNYEIKIENRLVMDQTSVARNEVATPGAALWNISAYAHWHVGGRMFITLLQVDNVFNTSFMNHLSFYRKLNAPEPGRNIQLIVKIPF
ncbi:MAG: TonB-dependent receptor, partial [Bacteroidales bacterium]|nr:TonB-dependent receptor [Bacteroidales bacterium]